MSPESQTTTGPVRWGIMGATSTVAQQAVLPAMANSSTSQIVAVASLSAPQSVSVHERYQNVRRYEDYEALLADDNIEAVYIALPNSMHLKWVLASLEAGRHVLCEKPLAMTASDATVMQEAARRTGRTLMEAYMSPYHPRSEAIEALVTSGRLGELRFARTAFTGMLNRPNDHRWLPEMGGGVLLDVGVYCLSPLIQASGETQPRSVSGNAAWTQSGVDSSFSGWLEFEGGFSASFESSFEVAERQDFELVGTDATIRCKRAFTPGVEDQLFDLVENNGTITTMRTPGGDCYQGMIEHFSAVLRNRVLSRRPPSKSIALAETVDALMSDALRRRLLQ